MFPLTPAGRVLQSESHTLATRCQVWHGGRVVAELAGAVTAGAVSAESDRPIMRNLTLTLVDETGVYSRTDVGELLSPYDAEVVPWRGVVLPDGTPDWAPLGVFRLTSTSVQDSDSGLTVDLAGQDRALTYQTPLPGPVTIAAGTPVEKAVQALLSKVNGALRFEPWLTGRTVGPLLYESDTQAWDAALTLAESVGGWLYHDRLGTCVLAPYTSPARRGLTRFADTLLSVSRGEDADNVHNMVIMQSADSGSGIVRVTAEDTDPDSPTYAKGAYGRRAITVTNPHLGTLAQAQEAAMARLIQELGRSQTVSFDCVPDVQVDPGDGAVIHRPRAGLLEHPVTVSGVQMPLGVSGDMQVGCRDTIISQQGVPV